MVSRLFAAHMQRIFKEERESHPALHVRRKMLVLWSLQCGLKRDQAAKVAELRRCANSSTRSPRSGLQSQSQPAGG